MPERLLNKVAVITGAGSGIGRAIAVRFLNEGAKVAIFGRRRELLDHVAELAPARVLVVQGDVTQSADLDQLVRATNRRFGDVNVLVPAAGIARVVPSAECSTADITEQFAVNFTGAIETVRLFLPSMSAPAAVLFVTGLLSVPGKSGLGLYNASKAAVSAFAQSLAVELAPRKIRVNCLAPGPVETPFWNTLKKARSALDGTLGSADDVAETAVFLASDAAKGICGQEIICDGGFSIA